MKTCPKCQADKPVNSFSKNKRFNDGLQRTCKACCSVEHKEWRENNPKAAAAANENSKQWQRDNLEYRYEYLDEWHAANPGKKSSYQVRSLRRRYRSDPVFRAWCCVRASIRRLLGSSIKDGETHELAGCTSEHFRSHIESLFEDWMCWENHGQRSVPEGERYWEIDHFFPLAAANPEIQHELLAVCNWRNMRPIDGKDNSCKSDEIYPEAQKLFDKLCREFSEKEDAA